MTQLPPRSQRLPTLNLPEQIDSDASLGVFDDRVVFGQSAAFSGPAKDLGTGMHRGIQAAFEEVNQSGGVHGRRLELVSFDDAYEPEAAIDNTQRLIDSGDVFALIGAVGTPTSRSAVPVASAADIPYIAPFTGAAFLRDPQQNNVINLRASYNQETEEMVARLVSELGIERIAVMYQDDSFGQAGLQRCARRSRSSGNGSGVCGLVPAQHDSRQDGSLGSEAGQSRRRDRDWRLPTSRFAHSLGQRDIGMNAVFVTISFVGSNALAQELGPNWRWSVDNAGGAFPV